MKEPRDKKRMDGEKIVKVITTSALALAVLLMGILVIYALKIGINKPAVGTGVVVTEVPPEEMPTEAVPETTAAPTTQAPTEEPEPEVDPNLEKAQAFLETLTLEQKIGQMIFATPDSLSGVVGADIAGTMTRDALERYPVGGVVYFSQNIRSESQTVEMVKKMQGYSAVPMFVGVDEEGGRVSRLSRIGITETLEPMATYGEAGNVDTVRDMGQRLGAQLLAAGFNLNFAPVADVITNPDNTEIGDRSFSSNPKVASEMVSAMTEGLQSSNVCACVKHFPGHGSTSADSHNGASVSNRSLDELRATEFLPFRAGIEAGAGMVMLSHMSLPAVTGDNTPCDLSYKVVTELLREELGYKGVIVSDSHEMASITNYYDCDEAAILAVQAGCDIVLMPKSVSEAYYGLIEAVRDGKLTEERINESVLRILTLKYRMGIMES